MKLKSFEYWTTVLLSTIVAWAKTILVPLLCAGVVSRFAAPYVTILCFILVYIFQEQWESIRMTMGLMGLEKEENEK